MRGYDTAVTKNLRILSGALIAIATVTASMLTVLPGTAAAATGSNHFTAYVSYGNPTGLRALEQRMGTSINLAMDTLDDRTWANMDDNWEMGNWQGSGFRMIWCVPMLPQSGGTLAAGATGAYDHYFKTIANDLVAHGMGNSVLRLGWEFNNSGYPWYAAGQPIAFAAYYRHIVTAMRSVSGAKFLFEWNPNLGDNGPSDKATGNLAAYYPGNAYVDIVALDVYDVNWDYYPGTAAEIASIKDRKWGLSWLANFGRQHGKPLSLAEFGLGWGGSAGDGKPYHGSGIVSGGDNPDFIRDIAAWIYAHNVVISGYWDYWTSSIDHGQNPMTAAAVMKAFAGGASAAARSHHRSKAQTTVTLRRLRPAHRHLRFAGRLSPAGARHKLVVQTARRAHGANWHSHGHVMTRTHGRYRVNLARTAGRRYLRVVSRANHHHKAAHSRSVRIRRHS
jgi:hypothetical protein